MKDGDLLGCWRAAASALPLPELMAAVLAPLRRSFPAAAIRLLKLVPVSSALTTVDLRPGADASARHHFLQPALLEALRPWCRHRGARLLGPRPGAPAAQWLPPGPGQVAVAGLALKDDAYGVLLVRVPDEADATELTAMLAALAEPVAHAVVQDELRLRLAGLTHRAEREAHSSGTGLGLSGPNVIGAERGLRPVMERVQMVAHSDVPVLLLGETGSGKEVVARAIHDQSPRAEGPFVRVNCGAIAPDLIDSELFGHERGSFTGASASHRGWFERAHGGTLILDEIGELTPPAQVRLLRILQDGSYQRVGGEATLHADVRVVAATHRDLASMVREGGFREDLWYRLAVFPILIPPLRERREDIADLAVHFARQAAERVGLPARLPEPSELALLGGYDWPGNVRELAAVMDRAALLGGGLRLEVAKALGLSPPSVNGNRQHQAATAAAPAAADFPTLDEAQRAHVEQALRLSHGRIEGAGGCARMLGINPHTLRARMRRLGIDWARFRSAEGESG